MQMNQKCDSTLKRSIYSCQVEQHFNVAGNGSINTVHVNYYCSKMAPDKRCFKVLVGGCTMVGRSMEALLAS